MTETVVHTLLVSSAFSAAFFGLYAVLRSAGEMVAHVVYLRTPAWKRFARRAEAPSGPRDSVDELPWETWRLVAGISGVIALFFALWGTDYIYLAVFGIAAAYIPSFVRRQMKENARWRLRLEVRDFVAELRLALALNVTVSQALEHLTQRSRETNTPFAERIAHHVERTLRMEGPEKMLEALAEEFDSEDLRKLLVLLRAALRGGMSLAEALSESADSIAQNILASAELSIEEMPTRLILPMLFALFPTIMVLALIPAVSLLVTSLSGVPTSP
ncbi:MAG: type II secretion system F family protein [Chloroflexi bacterium]|nr:type II secretion system F family protein [Chloroflexota bacterium]